MRYFKTGTSAIFSAFMLAAAFGGAGCSTGGDSATGTGGRTGMTGSGGSAAGTGGSSMTGTGGSATGTGGAGGGGVDGGGTGGAPAGPSVCDGTATRILAIDGGKVDNFESAMLAPGWYAFNDVMPTPNSFQGMLAPGGALNTGNAIRFAGMGAKTPVMGGYGVGLTYNLAIDKVAGIYCVDISAFDGVTFWAKAATAGSKVAVNFVLPETNHKMDGGDCMTGCYLHPQKPLTLTTTWTQYSVTFAEAAGGTAKVKNKLQILAWLSPDATWDFSLDEIQFYQGTPPAGPIPAGDGGM